MEEKKSKILNQKEVRHPPSRHSTKEIFDFHQLLLVQTVITNSGLVLINRHHGKCKYQNQQQPGVRENWEGMPFSIIHGIFFIVLRISEKKTGFACGEKREKSKNEKVEINCCVWRAGIVNALVTVSISFKRHSINHPAVMGIFTIFS